MNFLVAGSQHQTDHSVSQSLKPDRGMPGLFTGLGLFLERDVFVPASFKIDFLEQNGSRSSQSRMQLETGVSMQMQPVPANMEHSIRQELPPPT